LNNTYSGIAGELAVATALLRSGYKVAKPYWNNDVMDLLVLWRDESGHSHSVIPVQVKSVQRASSTKAEIAIEGLKKKYVERHPGLCLGIFSPEWNRVWFIPGAHNILKVHKAGVDKSKKRGGKQRTPFELLGSDSDVRIYVNLAPTGDPDLDKWLIKLDQPQKRLDKLMRGLTLRMKDDPEVERTVEFFLDLTGEDEEAQPNESLEE
jgi:hypothetical protein